MLSTYPAPLGNQKNKKKVEEHILIRNEFNLMMIQKGSNSYSELMLLMLLVISNLHFLKCNFYFFHIPRTLFFFFFPKC